MHGVHGCQEVPCAGAALTAALGQSPWHKSLTTLREAQDAGVQVNVVHLGATMASIAKATRWEAAVALLSDWAECVTPNILVFNTLIAALDKAEEAKKQFRRASQFFVNTRESTGVVLNRSAPEIVSCARRRLEGALTTLREANSELREAQADLRAYPVPEYLAPAQEQGAIMIGVTGYPGVGKSSWVNAVRRVSSPNDPDFAELCVDGPTMEPQMYRFPAQTNKPCVIWDLPGVGTAGFPAETYLQNLGIRHFDVVVLITDQRFTEAELLLLDDLRHWNVPFFMVRNKIDLDVQRELESEQEVLDNRGFGDKLDNEERRDIVRETLINVKEDLSILHHVDSVYCISAIKEFWHSFDFPRLEQDLTVALRRQRASEEGSVELVEG